MLHGVHVRAVGTHGDGDQLKAEVLRNGEVAVAAGDGAEKFPVPDLLPGLSAADAVGHAVADQLVNKGKAAVAADNGPGGVGAHHVP